MTTQSLPTVSSPSPFPNSNTQALAYEIVAARKDEFIRFFDTDIKPWLQLNKITARTWMTANFLFVLVSEVKPWVGTGGIPQLDQFVVNSWENSVRLPDVG